MTTSASRSPLRFTARGPEDLLALVPVVLGFQPADSLVLLTFGAHQPFHARVDLPDSAADDAATVDLLREPAVHHRVRTAAVIVFADEARSGPARRLGRRLTKALRRSGIDVVDALHADGSRWRPLLPDGHPGVPAWGVPYDLSSHPFTAQAVLDGRALLGSREELERGLEPDPAGVAAVAAALERQDGEPGLDAAEVAAVLARHRPSGRVPDADLARVLRAIRVPAVRDGAWCGIRRVDADEHVALWADAVRRSPEEVRGSAAAVLAFAAWMSGDGALAWCAIDRSVAVDPRNSLARLVADGLQRAVHPSAFEEGLHPLSQDR